MGLWGGGRFVESEDGLEHPLCRVMGLIEMAALSAGPIDSATTGRAMTFRISFESCATRHESGKIVLVQV